MPITNHQSPIAVFIAAAGFFLVLWFLPSLASASTNIDATQHWAWNDTVGWIDFYNQGNSNVTVSSSTLTGSNVSSFVGPISLDCGTASWGCSINYGVTNDGAGNLGGWAWNDAIGWISFYWGNSTSNPSSTKTSLCLAYESQCGVYINSSGYFYGYAWNDLVGWISFNCSNLGTSCPPNYHVQTSWMPAAAVGMLDSTTFDTSSTGAELNSVIWHGLLNGLPSGDVGFQFAASTSTNGPWTFTGPLGTTTTNDIYYASGPDTPIPITNYPAYSGSRYFRYRIILTTNSSQSISPQVTGVSVDWSP